MYRLYPRLIKALIDDLSQADAQSARARLGAIAAEVENDQRLLETLYQALIKAGRCNNLRLLHDLDRHSLGGEGVDITLAFERWQSDDERLRELTQRAYAFLSSQPESDRFSEPDRDQLSGFDEHLWSQHE